MLTSPQRDLLIKLADMHAEIREGEPSGVLAREAAEAMRGVGVPVGHLEFTQDEFDTLDLLFQFHSDDDLDVHYPAKTLESLQQKIKPFVAKTNAALLMADGSVVECHVERLPMAHEQIADALAAVLRQWLTPEQFEDMKRRNSTAEYATHCCASHDFCDANMAMQAAFVRAIGRAPNVIGEGPSVEADVALWNAAWEDARKRKLI